MFRALLSLGLFLSFGNAASSLAADELELHEKQQAKEYVAESLDPQQESAPGEPLLSYTDSFAAMPHLSEKEAWALDTLIKRSKDSYKHNNAMEHVILDPGNTDSKINDLSKKNHDKLMTDAHNALMTAISYTHRKNDEYARYSASILLAWATKNQTFTGKNGFLASAWGVGAMARAARILKESGSAEWGRIQEPVTTWMTRVAQTYWLPRDGKTRLAGTKPQLLEKWEMNNISNRTMTALEATMHVAYLIGDDHWFAAAVNKYREILPRFVVKASGENSDHFRGDPWHRQAGIASAVQLSVLAKRKGYDLFPLHNEALRRSAEFYAPIVHTQFIPFWTAIVEHYGQDKMPHSTNLLQRDKGSYYAWYIHGLEFLWGFPRFL
jgi:hypothetical protein